MKDQQQNKIIEEQKQTVEHQKHIVEEQNKDIEEYNKSKKLDKRIEENRSNTTKYRIN